MRIMKVDVPVQTLFASARTYRAGLQQKRLGCYHIRAHRHKELMPDGLYIFSVGYDEETNTGGFLMFVRAHTIERMFPDIAHRDVSPQWNTILHKLREMGVREGRIPALPHPADGPGNVENRLVHTRGIIIPSRDM